MTESAGKVSLRVLVVDDNLAVRTTPVRLLSKNLDLELLDAAESGEEAVEFALRYDAQVVVMDVVMPGFGGVEATRRLLQALPRIRVISHSANETEVAMRAAGVQQKLDDRYVPRVSLNAVAPSSGGRRCINASNR